MNEHQIDLAPFYKFAGDHVAVGIHAIDSKGKTILYNRKMREIEGFDFQELTDRSLLEMFRFDQTQSTLLKALTSGTPILNIKQTYWNRKGQEITTINDSYPVFDHDVLIGAVELARDVTTLERVIYQPLKKYEEPITFASLTAVSASMKNIIARAEKAAAAKLPVLLVGESGTGKELLAEAIHSAHDSELPMHVLYCHGTDGRLIDELGEEIERMQHGTIYCERIDLLPRALQLQLLEVVERHMAGECYFVASVGDDPVELVSSHTLVKDLYYFFSAMTIQVEPLRHRKEDILPFVDDYFSRHRMKVGSVIRSLSDEVKKLFLGYDWPGNLKELELLLDEITSLVTTQDTVTASMLPHHFKLKTQSGSLQPEDFLVRSDKDLLPLEEYLQEAEMYYLEKAMDLFGGNVTKAAQALGMSRQNLQYRLRKIKKNAQST